jgi:hypothetical protein
MRRVAHSTNKEPPGDARGEEAVQGWVSACHSCTLTVVHGCTHEEVKRVRAQIMLLGTEAVQVTRPKFGKLGNAPDHHDPSISCLKGGAVSMSKLRDCHSES